MTLSGELDQLFDRTGVAYDKDAANKIREANAEPFQARRKKGPRFCGPFSWWISRVGQM